MTYEPGQSFANYTSVHLGGRFYRYTIFPYYEEHAMGMMRYTLNFSLEMFIMAIYNYIHVLTIYYLLLALVYRHTGSYGANLLGLLSVIANIMYVDMYVHILQQIFVSS